MSAVLVESVPSAVVTRLSRADKSEAVAEVLWRVSMAAVLVMMDCVLVAMATVLPPMLATFVAYYCSIGPIWLLINSTSLSKD